MAAAVAAGMMAIPATPAAGQDWGLIPDSAGIPADSVRLPTLLVNLGGCGDRFRVVNDAAGVKEMRLWPECKRTDFGDLSRRTLVGIPMSSECDARFRLDAWRSEQRREYRVRAIVYKRRQCRIYGEDRYRWLVLPKLPRGWRVALTMDPSGRVDATELDRWRSWVLLPQPPARNAGR